MHTQNSNFELNLKSSVDLENMPTLCIFFDCIYLLMHTLQNQGKKKKKNFTAA